MSVIFIDEELTQIENVLGMEFIELYEKLWLERISAKNYYANVIVNIETTSEYAKIYWEYKLQEVGSVLKNQSQWLRKVTELLKGKISNKIYSKLEEYLIENLDRFDASL